MAFELRQADPGGTTGEGRSRLGALVEDARDSLSNNFNRLRETTSDTISRTGSFIDSMTQRNRGGGVSGGAGSVLYYPEQLAENNNWPYIRFSQIGGQSSIHLPMPSKGFSVNDGADYSSIDLGVIGASLFGIFNEEGPSVNTDGKSITGGALSAISIAAKAAPGGESFSNLVSFANQKVISKNTHVTFQSNTLRQYEYSFTMIAKSKKESIQIKKIIDVFRESVYGILDQSGMTVEYPKPWKIQMFFMNAENPFLPFIKYSYLTSVKTDYSNSTNLLHYDGSPVQIEVSLSFQETKILHRQDIQLAGQGYANDNSIDFARDVIDNFSNFIDRRLQNRESVDSEIADQPSDTPPST